jgi:hypothetical protein
MSPITCRDAAIALVRRGLSVFPLGFCTKEPLPRTRGFYDASTDERVIRRWYAGRLANVGVRTGTDIAGLTLGVLDLDGGGALALLDALERERGLLPETLTVQTARGKHLYFLTLALPSRCGLLPGVDFKCLGGYVVGPASHHPSGAVYTCTDWNAPIALAPDWLVDLVTPPVEPVVSIDRGAVQDNQVDVINLKTGNDYALIALAKERCRVRAAQPGSQDQTLYSAAWRMARFVRTGLLTESQVCSALASAAADWITSNYDPKRGPWTRQQIERAIGRGIERGITSNRLEVTYAA